MLVSQGVTLGQHTCSCAALPVSCRLAGSSLSFMLKCAVCEINHCQWLCMAHGDACYTYKQQYTCMHP